MYSRRTTQIVEGPQSTEFSTFRRKSRQVICQYDQSSFVMLRIPNSIPIALALVHFIKTPPKQNLTADIFGYLNMQQVPRQFINYQHQGTLESLLGVLVNKTTTIESAVDVINCFPIAQFVLNLYVRNVIIKFVNEGVENSVIGNSKIMINEIQKIELMGNEEEIVTDYSLEIRGTLLHLLALYLGLDLKVKYATKKDGNRNQQIVQSYGSSQFPYKVEMTLGEKLSVLISEIAIPNVVKTRPQTPLVPASRYVPNQSRIPYSRHAKNISEDAMSVRSQYESRSANKDQLPNSICEYCGKKNRFCQCTADLSKSKRITPRGMNSSISSFSPNLKSMFDVLGKSGQFEILRKCHCQRALCKNCQNK